jgi:hypothetical protein
MAAKYRTPTFRYGQVVGCARFGDVRIVKLSAGPIPWPIGQRVDRPATKPTMILYADLARAVRRESSLTVQRTFGVGPTSVWQRRKALGVPANNEGTMARRRDLGQTEWFREFRAKGQLKMRDPVRREKIAASKRGKPRPQHVHDAVRAANVGRPQSEETRAKRRAAHKARGTWPPAAGKAWADWEVEAVRTMTANAAVKKTGRTLIAVNNMRSKLGLRDGRKNSGRRRKSDQ